MAQLISPMMPAILSHFDFVVNVIRITSRISLATSHIATAAITNIISISIYFLSFFLADLCDAGGIVCCGMKLRMICIYLRPFLLFCADDAISAKKNIIIMIIPSIIFYPPFLSMTVFIFLNFLLKNKKCAA